MTKSHKTVLQSFHYKAAHTAFQYLVAQNKEMRFAQYYDYVANVYPNDLLNINNKAKAAVLNRILSIVQIYCASHNLPLINMLVCNVDGPKGTRFEIQNWQKHCTNAKDFKWYKIPSAQELKEHYKLFKILTNSGQNEYDAAKLVGEMFS